MQPQSEWWELLTLGEVRQLLGGLHGSTIYRLIARGSLPRPLKIGASSRWLRSECVAALAQMSEARS
jgi:predicted DNA-binding transcriptional regulator AlpA